MTAIDPAAVHADPDGGIVWQFRPTTLIRANPVISVSWGVLRDLIDWPRTDLDGADPIVTVDGYDPDIGEWADFTLAGRLTRWRWCNAEHLYRVHSYDPDTDCYLLVWPD